MAILQSLIAALVISLHSLASNIQAKAFVDPPSVFNSRILRPVAIMSSLASNGIISSLPNWRTANPDDPINSPPFSHHTSSIITAAPWSPDAYQSAIDLYERMSSCTDSFIAPMLTSALHDLEMAYRLYGPHCMVGSYNGGKDACVIFHLMRAVHAKYCRDTLEMQSESKGEIMIPRPRVIYFQHPDEFPPVTTLLEDTVVKYDVEMLAFVEGTSFPKGLEYLVRNNYPPGENGQYQPQQNCIKRNKPSYPLAFILGTRSDDPNAGSQGIYAPSSHYMPPFLRVNPILNWTYGHVWHFLRVFNLEYCKLYDEGYTSLGTVNDTIPCPALKKEDGSYYPAYMLSDWTLERAGRLDKKKKERKETNKSNKFEVSKHEVTMSQTSSTVSLPDASKQQKVEERQKVSLADVINQDGEIANSRMDESAIPRSPTVALIVIGDELLKGLTSDANVLSASRALRSYNVSLSRVSIISDDSQIIVDEIKRIRDEVDVVITSGGVGPTHDDVTVKSVAVACNSEIVFDADMARLLIEKMGCGEANNGKTTDELLQQLPEGMRKMASIPKGATLRYLSTDSKDEWPVLQCNNIFILPGVPNYFQNKIEQLAAYLSSPVTMAEITEQDYTSAKRDTALKRLSSSSPPLRSNTYRVILSADENSIVSQLNATVQANPNVIFGSYPLIDHKDYKTIITIEGRFYNGGYTKGSERFLSRALSDSSRIKEQQVSDTDMKESMGSAIYFSKQEMDENVKIALEDLKSRLPSESIVKVDTNDHLAVDSM